MGGFAPMRAPITGPTNPMIPGMNPMGTMGGMQGLLENPLFGAGLGLLSANQRSPVPPNYAQGIMGGLQMSQSAQGARQRQEMQKASYDMQMKQLAQQQQEWETKQSEAARLAEGQAQLAEMLRGGARPEEIAAQMVTMGDTSAIDNLMKDPPGAASSIGKLAQDLQAADPSLTPAAALAQAQQTLTDMKKAGASNVNVNTAGPFKVPSGYMMGADGNSVVRIPGMEPTEGQAAAGNYATRMQEASQRAAQVESTGGFDPTSLQQNLAGRIPVLGNYAQTPEYQTYTQAKEDWVRAKLRKESGAVIAKEEMQKEFETYWPMPGDSPQKIAAKAEARRVAEQGMSDMSGPAKPAGGGMANAA